MVNHGELQDFVLFGIEEAINNGSEVTDDCWIRDGNEQIVGAWEGTQVAEALYAKLNGWA